ncbi:AMP-binding protein [Peptococcus simiae]|uniref:AMP-binding protein n=1 Tax=Peptococcus simiae TaxID=1643805 RepID=A0ABW9GWN9_9FIRM
MLNKVSSKIESNINKYKDKSFIISSKCNITYAQIGEFINKYNQKMKDAEIEKGAVVIIDVSDRILYIQLIIATILSGRIVAHGNARISQPEEYIGKTAQAKITQANLSGSEDYIIDKINSLKAEISLEEVAFILETSGSTGEPKPCFLPINAISRMMNGFGFFNINSSNVHLFSVQPNFGAATIDIWGTILNGGSLVITKNIVPTQEEIIKSIKQAGVNFLNLSAPMFRIILEFQPEILNKVSTIVISGDFFPFDKYKDKIVQKSSRIIHALGCSEYGSLVAAHIVSEEELIASKSYISVGKGFAGSTVLVVSRQDNGQYVMAEKGELAINGDGLAVNLLKTRINNVEGCWYLTNDNALIENGNIILLGRKNDEIKVRGFRVSLSAIRSVVLSLPFVENAYVLPIENHEHGLDIILFVQCNESDLPMEDINKKIRMNLPKYMIPSKIVYVKNIPTTDRGKTDKVKLIKILKYKNKDRYVRGIKFFKDINIAELLPDKFDPDQNLISQGVTSIELIRIYEYCHNKDPRISLESILSIKTFFELRNLVER